MKAGRRIEVAAALLALAAIGCGGPKRYSKLDLPREDVAEVRGLDIAHGLYGPEFHVVFQAVNGVDLEGRFSEGLPQVIDLLPGRHTLVCRWEVVSKPENDVTSGTAWVQLAVQAGHVYQAELYWVKHEEHVRFHEVRPEDLDATRASRRL